MFNFLDWHNSFLDGVYELTSRGQTYTVAHIQQNRLFIVRRGELVARVLFVAIMMKYASIFEKSPFFYSK